MSVVRLRSDIVFSLGYWKILKKHQIDQVSKGVVNFHHSFNLKYKGRHSATWAIRNNEKLHGSTMHFIDEKVDQGKIIDSRSFEIEKTDTAETVFNKSNIVGLEILKNNFENIISENYFEYKKLCINENTHSYRKRDLDHEISLDSLGNTKKLFDEIRSLTFTQKPAPYIVLEGKKIFLKLEGYDSELLQGIVNTKQ